MKVLMLGRLGLMEVGGGDKVQIEQTANELRKLGVDVDIKCDLNVDVKPYDIVHVFQLDWTAEPYFYAKLAKKYNKPLVLSPIHHSLSEVKKFDDTFVFDYRRISKYIFPDQFQRDVFKNVYRSIFSPKRAKPTLISVFKGLKKMHTEVLKLADIVLVQTDIEAWDLKKVYGIDFKWEKVLNGVGEPFLKKDPEYINPFDFSDYIFCVGRIEPRKNQLSIIKAVKELREEKNMDLKLIFLGIPTWLTHVEYNLRFKSQVKKYPWITYVNKKIPYEEVPSYYHFAKVGVSASWFESTGLTSLEALFSGTNVVASGEQAKEYLGDLASYCAPDDIASIKRAIEKEYFNKRPNVNSHLKEKYTWKNTAKDTLKVYNDILESSKK